MNDSSPKTIEQTKRYYNRRDVNIDHQHAGSKFTFEVDRVSNPFDVTNKDGKLVMEAGNPDVVLQKVIVNLLANSVPASRALRSVLTEGIAAEDAGDVPLASEKYTAYLNGTQMSCSILSTSKLYQDALNGNLTGADITARVISVDAKNGKTVAINDKSVKIKPTPQAPTESAFDPFSMDADEGSDEA